MTDTKLTDIKGIGPVMAAALTEKSFTISTVASATSAEISEALGVGTSAAGNIIASAQEIVSEPSKTQSAELALAEQEVAPEADVAPEVKATPAKKKLSSKPPKSKKDKKDKKKKKGKKSDKQNKSGKKKGKGKKTKGKKSAKL